MDARLFELARQLIENEGRKRAEELLTVSAEGEFIAAVDALTGANKTGPIFRKYLQRALRRELFGEQATIVCAADLKRKQQKVRTGAEAIDDLFGGGGISVGQGGCIVEVSGKAGSGKSQLGMQLALMTVAPEEIGGLDSRCVHISTEGAQPTLRMKQIESGIRKKFDLADSVPPLMDGILLERCMSAEALLSIVEDRLPYLMRTSKARAVVVDSVAAPFRSRQCAYATHLEQLCTLGAALTRVAHDFSALIYLVNQVKDVPVDNTSDLLKNVRRYGQAKSPIPTLGLSWGSYISLRLMLSRPRPRSTVRTLEVLRAPHLPCGVNAEVDLTADGFCDVQLDKT
mmetsp:Transcript_13079/g.40288  ORF Transcript_13079/g.40288 Transcript_13079/m.40288 type:complete len:343 (+) Transcript_13079:172-1200(+)|eukprot:CAMPEP_0198726044 /NCGR_PEP_ID=MMETSP1475-20131203/3219_1 /TAXON_ID= ORGANISM="Unidentified sp., Strain CCMP1999" /NCGR_SAMPLE_ID=MMETSP1475 /ASSEMBLY_ACC=CAM_ASM_001111 /LENGTH=342 /DNA_ID=CAMNT_0044487919 /DNA_START=70 /DNA_END=1098 /DNA_ORIENTATION=+